MQSNHKITVVFCLIFLGATISSCKKEVMVPPPVDQVNTSFVFSNDGSANSAIAGVYIQMTQNNLQLFNNGLVLFSGLSADEFVYPGSNADYQQFADNNLVSNNNIVRSPFWLPVYNIIYQANNILKGLEESTGVTPALKTQMIGEAKFVRAFCYFYLVNIFGDVPLVTTTDFQTSASLPRKEVGAVYEQIKNDLLDAKNKLTDAYFTTGRVRPNKWAAAALLARVYLYQQQWAQAEAEATAVITSGTYSLVTNLNNVFLAGSNEAIWQLMPVTASLNTWDGNTFIPGSATVIPTYPLTNSLANSISNTDPRKTAWLRSNIVNGITYYYPYKYKIKTGAALNEYYMILRLAEQYLIRAEARTKQDKLVEGIADLNAIRLRAGVPEYPNNLLKDDILLKIEDERRWELFTEYGHRWLDLKRTNRADAVLSPVKTGWQPTDKLYPVPFQDMLANPSLTQNPGYQ